MRTVRIVSVPPGAAPLWVREKWVGLELPIAGDLTEARTVGVNVKPTLLHHWWAILRGRSEIIVGYRVEAKSAVDILETSSPDAAEWWRKNTPEYLRYGRLFVFHAEACRLVDGAGG